MKRNILLIAVCFMTLNLGAQNFKIFIQNSAFTSCTEDVENIERLVINEHGMTDKYLKDNQPFTGCAKTILLGQDGMPREYVVTEIENGYPVKALYYFTDGSISREFNFKDGRSHGVHIMYYEDGGKYIEEYYDNGRKHGSIKRWTKEGKLGRDGFFQGGMAIYDIVYVKDDSC